jgi:hypothetical protein
MRIFISVGDRDIFNPNGTHDGVEANGRMAKVLETKGYEYQYPLCRNAGHSIGNAQAQFLPHAIEWVWKDHVPKNSGDLNKCRPRHRSRSRCHNFWCGAAVS